MDMVSVWMGRAFARKAGKARIVVRLIKTRYNVFQIVRGTVNSTLKRKRATVILSGPAMTAPKV